METTSLYEKQRAVREPPISAGFPLVGAVPHLLRKQFDYLLKAPKKFGDLYTLNLGLFKIVMINHPDYAQHILRDNFRNYAKGGAMWDSIRELIGNGLVASEGEYWRRQRRMMQPHFHRRHLGGLTHLMVDAIQDGMQNWDLLADQPESFDVTQTLNVITMRVIVRALFGDAITAEETDVMGRKVGYAIDYMLRGMVTNKIPGRVPVPGRKYYRENQKEIDDFLYRIIAQRRQQPEHDSGDLFTMLLNMVDTETGEQMTDQQLRDEALTVFGAGYETTSVAMSWALYMLAQNPDIARKLRAQVDAVLGDRPPALDDLMHLSYPRMIMQEAMRLYPPAFWLPRTAVEDDVIDGYRIHAGQMIAVVSMAIHRHADFWPKPNKFDPERFAGDALKNQHPLAYLAFGAGQRQCIGKEFALMEGTLILAMLAQRYSVQPDPQHQPEPAIATTLSAKGGMWLRLQKR